MAKKEVVFLLLLMLPLKNGEDQVFTVCGQPVMTSRIVGGQASKIAAWPWQVSIRYNTKHFCGGSLVAKQWVLSAAHCFLTNPIFNVTVTLGAYIHQNLGTITQTIPVTHVIRNIEYAGMGTKGDIALLKLQRPVEYTTFILPVCVPSSATEFPEGSRCWVTGWGNIGETENLPPPFILQEVEVFLISVENCNNLYSVPQPDSNGSRPILDSNVCAGYEEGGKDACQGDSGGPLVCVKNDSWFLTGIVSWGQGCARPFRPGIFTRVTAYSSWLQRFVPDLEFGVVPIVLQAGGSSVFICVPLATYIVTFFLPIL